jgi:phosphoribosylformylglycinamidine synthase subunit PurS
MPRVAIDVLLKHEILDPQGRAVEDVRCRGSGSTGLGRPDRQAPRAGRRRPKVPSSPTLIDKDVRRLPHQPVIESFTWRVITDAERADAER